MEVRPGYKQTEIGVIPEEWEVKTVKQFGEIVTGGTPSTIVKEFWNGNIPWVTPTDISEAKDIYSSERAITSRGLETIRRLPANSVLVTCIASIGKNAVLRVEGACNQQINAIIPNTEHDADFLYYLIDHSKQYLLGNAGITATSIISKRAFSELLFSIPPLPEQRAIAAALSDVDALIAALDRLIAKKRAIKQGAMQQLLTGRKRLPGFSGKWEVRKVCEFGEVITGGTPSTQVKEYWGGDIPWVTPTDISDAKDILVTERQITIQGLKSIRALPSDSVLVTCIASIGKNAILRNKGGCNQQINAVVPNEANDADFLYYLFENSKQYLLGNAGMTATSIISKRDFSKLHFHMPRLEEQTAIATILSDVDAEIAALEARRDKTRALKQGMMQELLTGRIRLVG